MKLYTREEVANILEKAKIEDFQIGLMLDSMKPIELPSDEEIEDNNPYKIGGGNYNSQAAYQWQRGVEWVIEQIQKTEIT